MVVTAPRANQAQIETERAGTTAGLFRFSAGSSLLPLGGNVPFGLVRRACSFVPLRRLAHSLEKVPDAAVKAAGLHFASGDEHFTSRPFVPKVA